MGGTSSNPVTQHNNMVSLHAIHRYGIARHLPLDRPTSYAALADSTGLEPALMKRVVRHAITHRVFREPEKGFVEHTATSRLLTGKNANSWMGVGCEEMWPAALRVSLLRRVRGGKRTSCSLTKGG